METLSFFTREHVLELQREFGTPVYVYDQTRLEASAHEALAFPNAFGLTARYAMKALPTLAIIAATKKYAITK